VPYEDLTPEPVTLPPRPEIRDDGYVRPPKDSQRTIPDVVPAKAKKKS
jgi:hypothetical protein